MSDNELYVALPAMKGGAFLTTKKWLESREEDIALDIEDFGDLRGLFEVILNREPMLPLRPRR